MVDPLSPLQAGWQRPLASLNRFKQRHGRLVLGLVAVGTMSLSALAVAVAPMVNQPVPIEQRLLVETVPTLDLASQLEAAADPSLSFHKTLVVRGPDSVASVLRRAGLVDARASAVLARHEPLIHVLKQRKPRLVDVVSSPTGRVQQVVVRSAALDGLSDSHFERLTVLFDAAGQPVSRRETAPLQRTPRLAAGTVRSSLFAATDDAGLPDAVAQQLADIFSADIDFHRELRKGDSFSLVYESLVADGHPVPWDEGAGRVLAAEFRSASNVHQAHWFQAPGESEGQYFDAQGRSRKRAFLASPMEFSRVTSGFALRLHPILKEWRAHRGVDYAAPIGTPVRTVGDGVVEFAGWQSGYGKTVEIRHSQDRTTLYAHLSRIDVKVGQRVPQGSTIGAVGNTGMSTGPHLHFEFRVAGVHQDPLVIAKQTERKVLSAGALAGFSALTRERTVQLGIAAGLVADPGLPRFE
jgi:murein DD-endopeptidase MepM/ murein hydrolase activator NlpD